MKRFKKQSDLIKQAVKNSSKRISLEHATKKAYWDKKMKEAKEGK